MIPQAMEILGGLFGLSELLLALVKRSGKGSVSKDRGSLWMLWAVILVSVGLSNASAVLVPRAHSGVLHAARFVGAALLLGGLSLRWRAIIYLGRFFTVDVSVAADHKVVDSGPYRLIRHPSYAGALIAFLGLGICSENLVSALVLVLPITLAFLRRIAIEEEAMREALGGEYLAYAARTKRLIPWVY
jgi:protein-S-isoprenylcysteine O-methyltransferase